MISFKICVNAVAKILYYVPFSYFKRLISFLLSCFTVYKHREKVIPDISAPNVGDMSIEELLEKYKGAYASDFEAPSASASKASSDSEVSGDEEEETEEDESDVEGNSSSSGINQH